MKRDDNLIWIDLEMTGLDVKRDVIIEIATVVTDAQLNVLAEGPVIAVKQSIAKLEGMDKWNTKQHGQSGLVERVKASKIRTREAEQQTLKFLRKYISKGKSPMCGNTIHQDRKFLAKYMPELEQFFHYRHIDVSTIKELALRWCPEKIKSFKKESKHLALSDIIDSIDELKFYREHLMSI